MLQGMICGIDQTVHASVEALHSHLKTLRFARERYWHTYAPRRDLLTGELIPFRDYEQYTAQDFLNKINLKAWLKARPKEEGLTWAKGWLARRRADKGLVYAPSQAELRTLCAPSMPYYESVAAQEGGYYGVTETLGFKSRYTKAPLVFTPFAPDVTLICDTREQLPLRVNMPTVRATLNVGDYALAAPHDVGVRIERKGLSDMIGSIGKDRARFERELTRARDHGEYVIMMVENTIADAQRFDYLPQTKWVKAKPEWIMHNLRELLTAYPLTFQVVFCDGRREMAEVMMKVFQMGAQVKSIDLQFMHEEGLLCG